MSGIGDNRAGGIVGWNEGESAIRNASNEGNITVSSSDFACAAGIVQDSYGGIIENCFNKGRIEATSNSRVYLSGISSISSEMTINGCYNEGELVASGKSLMIGGISASPESNAIISNCYNKGTIETTENSSNITAGGILGNVYSAMSLKNCYNIGKLEIKGTTVTKGSIYAIMKGTMDNCYYLEQDGVEMGGNSASATITNSGPKTSEDMKKDEFITLLNKDSQKFKKDSNNVNGGYPILDWQ